MNHAKHIKHASTQARHLADSLSIKKRKKSDQLLLNSGHENQKQPFTKPDHGITLDRQKKAGSNFNVSLDLTIVTRKELVWTDGLFL